MAESKRESVAVSVTSFSSLFLRLAENRPQRGRVHPEGQQWAQQVVRDGARRRWHARSFRGPDHPSSKPTGRGPFLQVSSEVLSSCGTERWGRGCLCPVIVPQKGNLMESPLSCKLCWGFYYGYKRMSDRLGEPEQEWVTLATPSEAVVFKFLPFLANQLFRV